MDGKANILVKALQQKQLTLSIAESVTCGLATYRLSEANGTSDVLAGGITCYNARTKQKVLQISESMIARHTMESQEVTNAMAKKLCDVMKANITAAVTGLAAPGGSENDKKPVGTIFLAVFHKKKVYSRRLLLKGPSQSIKEQACDALYSLILEVLEE